MRLSYTKQADEAIRAAGRTAREMKHPYIGSEHLLLGTAQGIQWCGRTDPC